MGDIFVVNNQDNRSIFDICTDASVNVRNRMVFEDNICSNDDSSWYIALLPKRRPYPLTESNFYLIFKMSDEHRKYPNILARTAVKLISFGNIVILRSFLHKNN